LGIDFGHSATEFLNLAMSALNFFTQGLLLLPGMKNFLVTEEDFTARSFCSLAVVNFPLRLQN
jgi:hypothetical protein